MKCFFSFHTQAVVCLISMFVQYSSSAPQLQEVELATIAFRTSTPEADGKEINSATHGSIAQHLDTRSSVLLAGEEGIGESQLRHDHSSPLVSGHDGRFRLRPYPAASMIPPWKGYYHRNSGHGGRSPAGAAGLRAKVQFARLIDWVTGRIPTAPLTKPRQKPRVG